MHINNQIHLDFDDVMLLPKRSVLSSRRDVQLERTFCFGEFGSINCVPIVVSNMATVGTMSMSAVMSKYKIFTALHKHYEWEQLFAFFKDNPDKYPYIFYSIGESGTDLDKLRMVKKSLMLTRDGWENFPKLLMIDVANGYRQQFVEYVKRVKEEFPNSIICAGNVVTPEMTEELILNGVTIAKIGLGSGTCCSTRAMTGVGVPQLSAVIECSDAARGVGGRIMSDGGIKIPADMVKAFSGGADFVMIGSCLAGTDECEGEWVVENTDLHNIPTNRPDVVSLPKRITHVDEDLKKYFKLVHYGMASKTAMENHYESIKDYRASEGKTVYIPYKGPVEDIIKEFLGGLRSACTYTGSRSLSELKNRATFIRVR